MKRATRADVHTEDVRHVRGRIITAESSLLESIKAEQALIVFPTFLLLYIINSFRPFN